jgi:transposase
LGRVQVMG